MHTRTSRFVGSTNLGNKLRNREYLEREGRFQFYSVPVRTSICVHTYITRGRSKTGHVTWPERATCDLLLDTSVFANLVTRWRSRLSLDPVSLSEFMRYCCFVYSCTHPFILNCPAIIENDLNFLNSQHSTHISRALSV